MMLHQKLEVQVDGECLAVVIVGILKERHRVPLADGWQVCTS
jgi:hypothetical protein